ncbi:MAG: TetR/AcrR family transcriptional regulator [Woeseiaceae bacterium]
MKMRYKKSEDTRKLLLDTAEALFAERGFFGVSVRDITEAAGVRNASINYHFDTKENLFMAVIERRIEPLASARMALLEPIELKPDDPAHTVRLIAEAFAGPMLSFAQTGGPGWKHYCILVAHLAVQKHWGENAVSLKYDVHAKRFLKALETTFPDCSRYRIHACFQFLLSTTLYAVCDNKRIDTLSDGTYRSEDIGRLEAPFFDFVTGGMLAVANGSE